MITASYDMTGFNAGMAGLVKATGASMKTVVQKEAGELIKALVKVTPPKTQQRTNQAIARRMSAKFDAASRVESFDSRVSPGGIRWTGASKSLLYGVGVENDLRSVGDVKQIAALARRITKTGRTVSDFVHPRRRQKVSLSRKTFLQAGMLEKVIKYFQRHVGRLKAGWLVASSAGVMRLPGGNQPPKWVTRHALGAKGRFENGLHTPERPSFTIANFAPGIGHRAVNRLVKSAVKIRAASMVKNAKLYTSGKKNLADYAKGIV